MTITGVGNNDNYLLASLQARVKSGNTTTASAVGIDSVDLSTDAIDFALNMGGETTTIDASRPNSLFYALNQDVLYPTKNLASVGSAVDTYTDSLATSHVYDSSLTAPSTKFLADLANLKTAAASGNQADTESALTAAKGDAPGSVLDGMATAAGNSEALAGLQVEATENISDYLKTQGYSSKTALAEATAVEINGDTLDATFTKTYTPQTRLAQIQELSLFAAENGGSSQNSVFATEANPLFSIYENLLAAKSGTATDQSLTSLVNQYGVDTPTSINSNA